MSITRKAETLLRKFFQVLGELPSHPQFIEFQAYCISTLQSLRRINKQYNPLLMSFENKCPPPPPPTVVYQCKSDELIPDAYIILSVMTLLVVVIWCVWNNRKKENEASVTLDSSVDDNKIFKKNDYKRLKEVYKILSELKYELATAPERTEIPPVAASNLELKRRELSSRGLYSSVSKQQRSEYFSGNENDVNIAGNLKKALILLEKQLHSGAPEYGEHILEESEDDERLLAPESGRNKITIVPVKRNFEMEQNVMEPSCIKSSEINEFFTIENKLDDKEVMANVGIGQKCEKICAMCSKTKQALSFLQDQMVCRPNIGNFAEKSSNDVLCRRCSEENNMKYSELGLNLENFRSPSMKKISRCNYETNSSARQSEEALSISTKKKSLSIEILFNRDVELSKTVIL